MIDFQADNVLPLASLGCTILSMTQSSAAMFTMVYMGSKFDVFGFKPEVQSYVHL